jgi:hypothetical protein
MKPNLPIGGSGVNKARYKQDRAGDHKSSTKAKRTSLLVRFASDSPLEEAVSSEPVSEAKFPASWENTGNFVRRGLRVRLLARNPASNSMVCEPIPYASEQGIYFGLAGN